MPDRDPYCIFCRIVAGEADATILYEDEMTVAFMDLRQVVEGHCLVIPKRHIRDIFGLDDAIGAEMMATLRRVATATKAAFQAEGLSVWQSNDPPWQEVLHLHFHVMPRYWGDGVLQIYRRIPGSTGRDTLEEQGTLIRDALKGVG